MDLDKALRWARQYARTGWRKRDDDYESIVNEAVFIAVLSWNMEEPWERWYKAIIIRHCKQHEYHKIRRRRLFKEYAKYKMTEDKTQRIDVQDAIDHVSDPWIRGVLRLRCVNRMPVPELARLLNLDEQRVYALLKQIGRSHRNELTSNQ